MPQSIRAWRLDNLEFVFHDVATIERSLDSLLQLAPTIVTSCVAGTCIRLIRAAGQAVSFGEVPAERFASG